MYSTISIRRIDQLQKEFHPYMQENPSDWNDRTIFTQACNPAENTQVQHREDELWD